MTLDTLINKLVEAKEHCVFGNTEINIWSSSPTNFTKKDLLKGKLSWVDYDNLGVNLYFEDYE